MSQDYSIVPMTMADSSKTRDFLRNSFFRDEPLNVAVKLLGEDGKGSCPELEDYSIQSLEEPYSLAAVSSSGELIGVCLNSVHEPGHLDEMQKDADTCPNLRFRKILKLLVTVERRADLFNRYPHVDKMMEVRILNVDSAYRGRGIGTVLIDKTRELAREKGFSMVRVDCSSHFTARAVARLGFECVFSLRYDEFLGEDGKPVLVPHPPHEAVTTYISKV